MLMRMLNCDCLNHFLCHFWRMVWMLYIWVQAS